MIEKIREILFKVRRIFREDIFQQWGFWFLGSLFSATIGIVLTKYTDAKNSGLIVFAIILIFVLLLALISYKKSNAFNLLNILKRDLKDGNWMEIIRIAFPLSKPLWISKNYELRVKHGELIKKACDNLIGLNINTVIINDTPISTKSILSSVLIDDLGWTLYKYNKKNRGEVLQNINKGIELAENENITNVIKGYRHLSGIASENGKFQEMDTYHKKMQELLRIEQSKQRCSLSPAKISSINALINYAVARNELIRFNKLLEGLYDEEKNRKLDEILQHISVAVSYFKENDPIEYAKTFCITAKVYLIKSTFEQADMIENLDYAKNCLEEGLKFCKENDFRDHFIRISILLLEEIYKRLETSMLQMEEFNMVKQSAKIVYDDSLQEIRNLLDENQYKSEIKKWTNKIKKCMYRETFCN